MQRALCRTRAHEHRATRSAAGPLAGWLLRRRPCSTPRSPLPLQQAPRFDQGVGKQTQVLAKVLALCMFIICRYTHACEYILASNDHPTASLSLSLSLSLTHLSRCRPYVFQTLHLSLTPRVHLSVSPYHPPSTACLPVSLALSASPPAISPSPSFSFLSLFTPLIFITSNIAICIIPISVSPPLSPYP